MDYTEYTKYIQLRIAHFIGKRHAKETRREKTQNTQVNITKKIKHPHSNPRVDRHDPGRRKFASIKERFLLYNGNTQRSGAYTSISTLINGRSN